MIFSWNLAVIVYLCFWFTAWSADITRPANQRIRSIGTFYDARTETYLSRGCFIQPIGDDEVTTNYDEFQKTSISVTDELGKTEASVEVDGDLEISILSGMVTGGIGGKYQNVKIKSANAVIGMAKIRATTVYKHIDICNLEFQNLMDRQARNIIASHLLTGISYGANIYIWFTDDNNENERREEIAGYLRAAISKFASLVQGSLSGSADFKNTSLTSRRNLRVEIEGDIGFTSGGAPLSEEELIYFLRSLHLHLNAKEGKIGRPIEYKLTSIEGVVASCLNHNATVITDIFSIETKLQKKVIRTFKNIEEYEEKVDKLYGTVLSFEHCLKDDIVREIRSDRDEFETMTANYREKLKNAIIKARSENSTLLESVTADLSQEVEIRASWETMQSKYEDTEEAISKLEFYLERGIPCIRKTRTIESSIFSHLDSTYYMFLYNEESYRNDSAGFYRQTAEMIDNCRPIAVKCFVVDCDVRKDGWGSYDVDTIYLYIRRQLKLYEGKNKADKPTNSTVSPILLEVQNQLAGMQNYTRMVDRLLNNMYRDARNRKVEVNGKLQTLELQLNYTYAYQKLMFEYVLDDVINNNVQLKVKSRKLNDFDPFGGITPSKFCRPEKYIYLQDSKSGPA